MNRRSMGLLVCFAGLAACGTDEGTTPTPTPTACSDAEARLGHRVCVHEVPDRETWTGITFEASAVDQVRATTYLVPAREDARLPTSFVDANAFTDPEQSLHYKFLTESFPEFRLLDYDEYLELVIDPERREWFAGGITEYLVPDGENIFGITIADAGDDPAATVPCESMREVARAVGAAFRVGDVAIVPANDLQRQALDGCDVPVHDPATALDYELYARARGCGTLRRFTTEELAAAEDRGEIGWQDVLVTEEAPLDVETVIAGIVTGTRQGELSHLNVRSAARGTPNCYVRDAVDVLARWEGQLVELECGTAEATVRAITPEEAETCWQEHRHDAVELPPPDLEWAELVGLLDVPTDDAAERRVALERFGAKGTNLAVLYQRIDEALRLDGFLIPFHAYAEFVATATASIDLGDGPETVTFSDAVARLVADEAFATDGALRRARLQALGDAMRSAACDPALVEPVAAEIRDVFGTDDVMVRFRSSSNAEDGLDFSGAGLYNSTSVCLADDTDADELGPSRCDPAQPEERGVCRGLTKVWSSLWNPKAFDERAWYGIDQEAVAMGILVDTRVDGELANVVAFTGNPTVRGDDRYLVNAQVGAFDVVSALPGVWPEKDLLTLEDGEVTAVERARGSTELPDGQWVLDEAPLAELGARLAEIAAVYPLDLDLPPTATVLLDTEWKVRADGRLVVKQIRPYLR